MTIKIVEKPRNLTIGFEGVFLLHLKREDQPVISEIKKNPQGKKKALAMVTDRDPAPVCLFSLRGQACLLPEREHLKIIFRSVGLKPEVGKTPVKMVDVDSPSAARRVRCQGSPGFDINLTC